MTNEEVARKIISENIYITISTVSNEGEPWISPLYSRYDERYNFYWVSDRDRQHSQNIKDNGQIALVIFDTHVQEGNGRGVYISARAQEVDDPKELEKNIHLFYPNEDNPAHHLEELVGASRSMYKAVPETIWVTDATSDDRIEVHLL